MNVSSRVRLHDIATAANTSVATVSLALAGHPRISQQTRRHVRELSRRLGYQPRQTARAALQGTVNQRQQLRLGFFSCGEIESPVSATLLNAFSRRAAEQKLRLEVSSTNPDTDTGIVEQGIQFGRALDGLIVMGKITPDQVRDITNAGVATVVFGYLFDQLNSDSLPAPVVTSDWQAMGERATHALIQQGHRRIAFVSGELTPGMWHARCLNGYVAAHVQSGLDVDRRRIFTIPVAHSAGSTAAHGVLALEDQPTAYVCVNVGTASRFVGAMNEAGRRVGPDNVVICGLPYMLHELNLEQYAMVHMDAVQMIDTAITQLRTKCLEPGAINTTILVPFQTRQLEAIKPPASLQP